jgi:transketolase
MKAQEKLASESINVNVIDLFSVKPLDKETIYKTATQSNGLLLTVEDHYAEGGIFGRKELKINAVLDAVSSAMADKSDVRVFSLAITELPRSGMPEELLEKYGISANKIIEKIKSII